MSSKRVDTSFGTFYYFKNTLHREDGPAAIYNGGPQVWYKYGLRHRTDGPALIHRNNSQFWYQKNLLHRDDGPAVILPNNSYRWFLQDIPYKFNDWLEKTCLSESEKTLMILRWSSSVNTV